jgi:hypothetical protein
MVIYQSYFYSASMNRLPPSRPYDCRHLVEVRV